MSTTPEQAVTTYVEAWAAKDFDRLRGVLADDVTFQGPLARVEGADACIAGLTGMSTIMTGVEVHHRWADGDEHEGDVITWFDLHTSVASPAPTANWSHVVDGRITRIQVAFDPRELAPPS